MISAASIKQDNDAGVWHIIRHNINKGAVEEMVFTLTGAIFAMDLPPVTKETR